MVLKVNLRNNNTYDLAIIGTVGLPAIYGGFETLTEQLSLDLSSAGYTIQVFCSGKSYPTSKRLKVCNGAHLKYIEWNANGWQSVIYDAVSIFTAARQTKRLLILGVSGCIVLPILKFFYPKIKIVINVDGIEWKRSKWGLLAKFFLKISECIAVKFSDVVIADNYGICEYINLTYKRETSLIAYGGDQAINEHQLCLAEINDYISLIFDTYYLSICRIEPENNIDRILQAFSNIHNENIILVGNWDVSSYSKDLKERFKSRKNIKLLNPIYNQSRLWYLKKNAKGYIHGHSAGGTNPSLVEAMHADLAILSFDVSFNRYTTHNKAIYWRTEQDLHDQIKSLTLNELKKVALDMKKIAIQYYSWNYISSQYKKILF